MQRGTENREREHVFFFFNFEKGFGLFGFFLHEKRAKNRNLTEIFSKIYVLCEIN